MLDVTIHVILVTILVDGPVPSKILLKVSAIPRSACRCWNTHDPALKKKRKQQTPAGIWNLPRDSASILLINFCWRCANSRVKGVIEMNIVWTHTTVYLYISITMTIHYHMLLHIIMHYFISLYIIITCYILSNIIIYTYHNLVLYTKKRITTYSSTYMDIINIYELLKNIKSIFFTRQANMKGSLAVAHIVQ